MQLTCDAWSRRSVELPAAHAEALSVSGLARVEVEAGTDRWTIVTDSKVGMFRSPGLDFAVRPKLAIPQLMFLLGYASDPRGWRNAEASYVRETDLFSAITSGFSFHALRAVEPIPLRGYVAVEEESVVLKGRLRVADQIARSAGLPIPAQIAFDDHSADIGENRLVRGAAELLLRFPRIPSAARQRLLRVRAALEEAAPTRPAPVIPKPAMNRLNARYRSAMALAHLILTGTSVSTMHGETTSVGFVFDMNRVFEDFLTVALSEALQRWGGRVMAQYQRRYLDREHQIRLIPDLTWWRGDQCLAIIDAKYKPLDDLGFPNADAYQMLAYCVAFDLPDGHLVYARDAVEADRRHQICGPEITIRVHAVDVELPPSQVLARVDRLAHQISASLDRAGTRRL